MGMTISTLKWHPEAVKDFIAIIRYCNLNFGRDTAKHVRNKILSRAELLIANPYLGIAEPTLSKCTSLIYRSLLVAPFTKIIYTIHEDYIYIHIIWDVRQHENKLVQATVTRYQIEDNQDNSVNEQV